MEISGQSFLPSSLCGLKELGLKHKPNFLKNKEGKGGEKKKERKKQAEYVDRWGDSFTTVESENR